MIAIARTSPSLALIKYWGKLPGGVNLPATPSLAVTLQGLETVTRARMLHGTSDSDEIAIDGRTQPPDPYLPVLDLLRERAGTRRRIGVDSTNSFPTAAGLASSSSGFAALALAVDRLLDTALSRQELSAIARVGSGSAARAVYGGFTCWERGADSAHPFLCADHWPELRILVSVVSTRAKPVASRPAMELARTTSRFYREWESRSTELFAEAKSALERRDLTALGEAMQESYLAMFATMFTSRPSVFYWLPESVRLIQACRELRGNGVPAWETMDAGPQVKIVTTSEHADAVVDYLTTAGPGIEVIPTRVGNEPIVTTEPGPEESR